MIVLLQKVKEMSLLPDPDMKPNSPIKLAWLYSLHAKCLETYTRQTFKERAQTIFLFKMFPYAFSTNNEEFIISISRLLNLHESVLFFCKIFHASLVPNSSHYWTIEEDMYLLHLLIHAYINQQSLNVSFGKRTIFSCKRRIIYLKKILVHETLIADYIVPEYKKCNGHDCETENNDMQDFNEAILDEKKRIILF